MTTGSARPLAAFSARLRRHHLHGKVARQLLLRSTILQVETSSTGDTRLRGAPRQQVLDVRLPPGKLSSGLMTQYGRKLVIGLQDPPAIPSSSASVRSFPAALAFALTCSFASSTVKA